MKVDLKVIIVIMIIVCLFAGGFYYYKKSAPERAYKAEIKKLRFIEEHQGLEIKVYRQKVELNTIQKEIEKNTPKFNLMPAEDANE